MKPQNRLEDALANLEKTVRQSRREKEEAEEIAFIRKFRTAFAEFLETKDWCRAVGAEYWPGEFGSKGRTGMRFMATVKHPDFIDFEMVIEIKSGPN